MNTYFCTKIIVEIHFLIQIEANREAQFPSASISPETKFAQWLCLILSQATILSAFPPQILLNYTEYRRISYCENLLASQRKSIFHTRSPVVPQIIRVPHN